VVLTNDTRVGRAVLDGLVARGIEIAAVIVESSHALRYCRRAKTPAGRVVETPVAIARSVWRRIRARRRAAPHIGPKTRLIVAASRDDRSTRRRLASLHPDILVLSGVGLVGSELLSIPTMGTLNSHPGLLPWVRGNGVVAHAIERGVAVGSTCHRVDAGIDTGPILGRRLLPVDRTDTLETLEERAAALGTQLMVDVVAGAIARGELPGGIEQQERYPLCRWRRLDERQAAADLVASGRAFELFLRWKSLVIDRNTGDLPLAIASGFVPPISVAPLPPRRAPGAA
jgi:methionyl-tRNA formyltransferase